MEDYIRYSSKHAIFTREQLFRLANIADNAGQVIFGVMVLSPLVVGFDSIRFIMIVWGIISTLASWWYSLYITKIAEKK